MIESDLEERRRRSVGGDVAADAALFAVGAHDHRQRVPPRQALDPPLDLAAAGINRLSMVGNEVGNDNRTWRMKKVLQEGGG
jgi:hypothetical protein